MINELAKQVHENAKAHGFFDKEKNIGEMLCLIHSEVSEALESDRNGMYVTYPNMDAINGWVSDKDFLKAYKLHVKSNFEEEMADIVIRVMDLCAFKGIDLEAHIKAKMRYNSLREYKHSKKY
jgi:NTP pyrophosphatase (non-canonical NTP hydrolase)